MESNRSCSAFEGSHQPSLLMSGPGTFSGVTPLNRPRSLLRYACACSMHTSRFDLFHSSTIRLENEVNSFLNTLVFVLVHLC